MILETVRSTVQPELDQDFDALYEEYVADTGQSDLAGFIAHLHDFGLISDETAAKLTADSTLASSKAREDAEDESRGSGAIDWSDADDGEDWDDATVLRPAKELMEMAAEAAGTVPQPEERQVEAPAPPTTPVATTAPPLPRRLEASKSLEFVNVPATPAQTPDPTHKRTSFRRRDDGALEETGAFRRARRRRRDGPTQKNERDTDRYGFIGTVGEGAMGQVLLAEDKSLRRKIAFKEMSDEIASQPTLASKFLVEAQVTAQLDHPNIVPVYTLEGEAAYTMKLIKGDTVEQLLTRIREKLEKGQPPGPGETLDDRLEMFMKVCEAMAYAHARGVIHRDLKPENVMIGEFGEVYVMDWGIAHIMEGEFDEPVQVEGMEDEGDLIIGTAGYMSPEQADARTAELTGASDQYALGLILFELVSLRLAVTGKNAMHMITRHQEGEVDELVHLKRKRIAPELIAIVRRATASDPARRYAGVADLEDDIRRFLRGEAIKASPDNPWQALVRFTGRHRQATLLSVMMLTFSSLFFVMLIGVYTQVTVSRAAAREQATRNLVTTIGRQASSIDGQMVRFEALLMLLSTSAEDLINLGDPRPGELYLSESFGTPGLEPPDMMDSPKKYGTPISLEHSAFILPPDAISSRPARLSKLLPLTRHFRKVMLQSAAKSAASADVSRAKRWIRDVDLPITWAYVALDDGSYDIYPGHGGYEAGFDPRTTPWYKLAMRSPGPQWGRPVQDEDAPGIGAVLPCSIQLVDSRDEPIGVAAIDISLDHLADKLMSIDELRGVARAFLVDSDGNIVVDAQGDSTTGSRRYPDDAVREEILANRSGHRESNGEITVYTRMPALNWHYVVVGPTSEMLAAAR